MLNRADIVVIGIGTEEGHMQAVVLFHILRHHLRQVNRIVEGEALRNLGKHHQVLTITHLHQVASRAQNQLSVSKTESDGRTYTSVTELDGEKRIDELVRMLGGNSATVREHARQLLENNK